MLSTKNVWLQSLLILHPSRTPGMDEFTSGLATSFPSESQEVVQPVSAEEGTFIKHWKEVTARGTKSEAELSEKAPFWPGLLRPRTALVLIAENEVVVQVFPSMLSFVLQWTVCGVPGVVSLAWQIRGPYRTSSTVAVIVQGDVHALPINPLNHLSELGHDIIPIGTTTVRSIVNTMFPAPGLYGIMTTLNQEEAGIAPLLVRQAID